MSEFWYTVFTMQDIKGEDYQAFSLFGRTHLIWLAICAVVCVAGFLLYKRLSEKQRRRTLLTISIVIVALEVTRQTMIIVTGQWIPDTLPLHLCSMNIGVCLWYSIHPNKLAGNILYALCLPGAALALLSPSWLALPVWNFCHIDSEILHILLLLYPLLLISGGLRPDTWTLPKVAVCLAGVCMIIYPFNYFFGTNFLFLNDPHGNAIASVFSSIFGEKFFLLGYVITLLVIFAAFYLPYYLFTRHKKIRQGA